MNVTPQQQQQQQRLDDAPAQQQKRPASRSSKDTDSDAKLSLDKMMLDASPPPSEATNDGDKKSVVEDAPSTTKTPATTPIKTDYLAFFEDGNRTIQDKNGDDDFHLDRLSLPFPFFPVETPYSFTRPIDQPRSATITTPDDDLTSLLLGGSSGSTPPSRTHSLSMFDGFPPMKMDPVNTSLTAQNHFFPPTPKSTESCECLSAVIFAVEEFETACNSGSRAELDSIIANQKEAIKCCRAMVKCEICMSRRENLILLVFMCERIVAACGRIVTLYRANREDDNQWLYSMWVDSPHGKDHAAVPTNIFTEPSGSSEDAQRAKKSSLDWQELLVGDYEISSRLEWEQLLRVLLSLQLKAVMGLLAEVKNKGSQALGDHQTTSLSQAEVKVGELEREISHMYDVC